VQRELWEGGLQRSAMIAKTAFALDMISPSFPQSLANLVAKHQLKSPSFSNADISERSKHLI